MGIGRERGRRKIAVGIVGIVGSDPQKEGAHAPPPVQYTAAFVPRVVPIAVRMVINVWMIVLQIVFLSFIIQQV